MIDKENVNVFVGINQIGIDGVLDRELYRTCGGEKIIAPKTKRWKRWQNKIRNDNIKKLKN